jgi:hypothetical protein
VTTVIDHGDASKVSFRFAEQRRPMKRLPTRRDRWAFLGMVWSPLAAMNVIFGTSIIIGWFADLPDRGTANLWIRLAVLVLMNSITALTVLFIQVQRQGVASE